MSVLIWELVQQWLRALMDVWMGVSMGGVTDPVLLTDHECDLSQPGQYLRLALSKGLQALVLGELWVAAELGSPWKLSSRQALRERFRNLPSPHQR